MWFISDLKQRVCSAPGQVRISAVVPAKLGTEEPFATVVCIGYGSEKYPALFGMTLVIGWIEACAFTTDAVFLAVRL